MTGRRLAASVVSAALAVALTSSASPASGAVIAPQAVASTVSGWSTTAATMKVGGELSRSVTVKPAAVRTVLVQARKGTTGSVTTRATLTTSASGAVTARFAPTSTGTWYVRLSVRATSTYAGLTTAWRKVTVSGTAGSTTVSTPTVSPSTVLKPAKQTISATVKPAGARSVEVWAKAPGSSTYLLRGRTTSSSTGLAKLTWSAPTAGAWTYKVYVRPSLTLKGVWSGTRTATVTDLPAQVTDLVATPGPDQVSLSWTNPTAYLSKVVVRRTSAPEAPASTPTQGTAVPLSSDKATSVTVTGLPFNGGFPQTYTFSVFTLDSAGRSGPPMTTESSPTDTPPGPVSDVSVDTSSSPTSATLTWTNPTTSFGEVRVRRTLVSQPAPESAFDGTEVTLSSTTATTVVDSGLQGGTAYRWTFFPISPYGTPGTAVSVEATTMASALAWGTAQKAVPMQGSLLALSCPTTSFCLAGDQFGNVLVRSGGAWSEPIKVPGVSQQIRSVSCATDLVCVLVTFGGDVVVRAGDGSFSTPVHLTDALLFAVGCTPTGSFCLAGDSDGKVYRSTDRQTWSAGTTLPTPSLVLDIDCVSPTFCALTGAVGRTWTFSGVVAGVPQVVLDAQVTTDNVDAVDCVSTAFCMYVTDAGTAWKLGGTSASIGSFNTVNDVSCVTDTFCRVVDYSGYVFTYDGSTWASTRPDSRAQLVGVGCPTTTSCITIDGSGAGWTSSWNGTSWSSVDPIDPYSGTTAISCTSSSFCMVVDQAGRATSYDGSAWQAPVRVSYPNTLMVVECASPTRCFASGFDGTLYAYDGDTWSEDPIGQLGERINDIACPASNWCVLVTAINRYSTWNGTAWAPPAPIDAGITAPTRIRCATATYCMAADWSTSVRIFDGSAWGLWNPMPTELVALDCAAESLCIGIGGGTAAYTWTGTSWSEPDGSVSASPILLDCTSSTFCEAVAYNPLDSSTWDGSTWSVAPASPLPQTPVQDLSCVGFRFCAAVDQAGEVYLGTR